MPEWISSQNFQPVSLHNTYVMIPKDVPHKVQAARLVVPYKVNGCQELLIRDIKTIETNTENKLLSGS